MQTSLIYLLAAMLVWSVVSYRLGFRRPWHVFQHYSQAAFLMLVFVLIPFVILVLRAQAGAEEELAELGITPHPALEESSGIAAGIPVEGDRVWVFHSDEDPSAVLQFYRDPETRAGWEVSTESAAMLILRRGAQRITIAVNESWTETVVMYSYSSGGEGTGH